MMSGIFSNLKSREHVVSLINRLNYRAVYDNAVKYHKAKYNELERIRAEYYVNNPDVDHDTVMSVQEEMLKAENTVNLVKRLSSIHTSANYTYLREIKVVLSLAGVKKILTNYKNSCKILCDHMIDDEVIRIVKLLAPDAIIKTEETDSWEIRKSVTSIKVFKDKGE